MLLCMYFFFFFFFFQAEDGIRDKLVTGVQTCALPIYPAQRKSRSLHEALQRSPGTRSSRCRGPRHRLRNAPHAERACLSGYDREERRISQETLPADLFHVSQLRPGSLERSEEHTSELQSL